MKMSMRFSSAQAQARRPSLALSRPHPMSDGGMDVSDAKRLRSLEDENRKLKKLLAESMLDQAAKELLTKMYGPPRRCKVFSFCYRKQLA